MIVNDKLKIGEEGIEIERSDLRRKKKIIDRVMREGKGGYRKWVMRIESEMVGIGEILRKSENKEKIVIGILKKIEENMVEKM